MRVKRHISLLLVLALLLGSSVTSLELRADVLPKYLGSKVDVEIIKTDIIADGVKNTEGYASLRRDNQVDKSNMDERDWQIKKDSYALVAQNGSFVFDYDVFFCDFR